MKNRQSIKISIIDFGASRILHLRADSKVGKISTFRVAISFMEKFIDGVIDEHASRQSRENVSTTRE